MISLNSPDTKSLLPCSWHKGHKYYNLHIQPDLFGGASLIKTWGGKGSKRGGCKVIYCESEKEATIAIGDTVKRRKLRGYRPYRDGTKVPSEELLELIAGLEGNNNISRLKQLIKPGIDINLQDHEGYTALYWATYLRKFDVVASLIACGSELDIQDHDGCTPLMESSWKGHIEMVKMLLKYGANVNIKSYKLYTALTVAILGKHLEIVKLLLKAKADIHAKDLEGKDILQYAISSNNPEIIALIEEPLAVCGTLNKHQMASPSNLLWELK